MMVSVQRGFYAPHAGKSIASRGFPVHIDKVRMVEQQIGWMS